MIIGAYHYGYTTNEKKCTTLLRISGGGHSKGWRETEEGIGEKEEGGIEKNEGRVRGRRVKGENSRSCTDWHYEWKVTQTVYN